MMVKPAKEWYRLDNAAMMFPSSSGGRNSRVFRFTCELTDEVEPDILQLALDETVKQNPDFVCTMRSGLFWHYLERSQEQPRVRQERYTPCFPIYDVNRKHLLFYVSYYRRRIHVETYHALTDGTGAALFIKMLVMHYLLLSHPEELADVPAPDYPGSLFQRAEDSFGKHYSAQRGAKGARISMPRACQIHGRRTADGHYNLTEAVVSAKGVNDLAHSYGTTVTGLLCALYIRAIAEGLSDLEKRRPIVVTVPFNLRNIFPSLTQRNFFATSQIAYYILERGDDIASIAKAATEHLKSEETKRALIERMDSLVSMQRNPFLRAAPLFMKDAAMSISKRINEKGETAVLSNVSRVELPEPMQRYVRLFSAASSTSNMHLCVLTCGDNMALTFSSSLRDNEVARAFLRSMTAEGLSVTVSTNYNQL